MMVIKTKLNSKIAILLTPRDSDAIFAISKKIVNIVDCLSDSVLFLCGHIPDSIKWPNNIRKIDLNVAMLVTPVENNVSLFTIARRIASGKPIIATDNPGLRTLIIDQLTGFLIPNKDKKILADNIEQL